MLFDLQDKEADLICNEVILGTCQPLNLQKLSLSEVEHFNLALNQELDFTSTFLLASQCLAFSRARELEIDLGIVGMQIVAKNLDVVFIWHPQSLLHRCTLERSVLVDFAFFHD